MQNQSVNKLSANWLLNIGKSPSHAQLIKTLFALTATGTQCRCCPHPTDGEIQLQIAAARFPYQAMQSSKSSIKKEKLCWAEQTAVTDICMISES